MKHKLSFLAILLMALAIPQSVKAYNFSAVSPSGHTLYYMYSNINDSTVTVTRPNTSAPYWTTPPTGNLVIPDSVTYSGHTYAVTCIGSYAFSGCSGLTTVTIPNSVTTILWNAFSGCSGLASVTIPNSVTSISSYAFSGCSALTSITIPNSVTSIASGAFSNSGLTSIVVASSNNIYDSRNNCNAIIETSTNTLIQGCQNTTIPNSVTSIGDDAFRECRGLTSITIPDFVDSIVGSAFINCSGLTTVNFNAINCTIMGGGGNSAFNGCENLTTLNIGNNVTRIPAFAFKNCSGLTSVTIPNSVTSIGIYAFANCSGLTSVTIGNSVTSIGIYAFANCSGLTSVTIGNSVTTIGNSAFSNCSGLTSVTIPNSVTSIGTDAFASCSGLTSVTIGNSVTTIGNSAFSNCSGLTTLNFNADSCVFAGNYNRRAFAGCDSIRTVTFGNNVKAIPAYLLYNCSRLTSVIIPNSVTTIDTAAFSLCTGLTSITIPNNVTTLGPWAFRGCTSLANVVVGNGVANIQDSTFAECNHITNLTLGSGLRSIAASAFHGCNAVLRMNVRAAAPPTSTSNPFRDFNTGIPVTVPCSSVTAYQNAAYWGFFTNISGQYYTFTVTPQDPNMGFVTIISQPSCENHQAQFSATAYDGYRFVSWSDGNTQNPRSLVVNSDTELQAVFAEDIPRYTLTVVSANSSMGSVSGGGTYNAGDTVRLTATANNGYHFTQWQDGITLNPRVVTITSDTTFIAYFEADGGPEGIGDAGINAIKVYAIEGHLVVEGSEGAQVTLYDAVGRLLATKQDNQGPLYFDVPATGAYLVRVGNHPARRIVVVK